MSSVIRAWVLVHDKYIYHTPMVKSRMVILASRIPNHRVSTGANMRFDVFLPFEKAWGELIEVLMAGN